MDYPFDLDDSIEDFLHRVAADCKWTGRQLEAASRALTESGASAVRDIMGANDSDWQEVHMGVFLKRAIRNALARLVSPDKQECSGKDHDSKETGQRQKTDEPKPEAEGEVGSDGVDDDQTRDCSNEALTLEGETEEDQEDVLSQEQEQSTDDVKEVSEEDRAVAATKIQRNVRKWLVRLKAERLEELHIYRRMCAQEILSSERKYVEQLQIIVDLFYTPVQSENVLSPDEIRLIFSDIPIIRSVNDSLLTTLKGRVDNWSLERKLGDIFVKMSDYLRVYCEYVKSYHPGNKKMKSFPEDHPFWEFYKRQLSLADDIYANFDLATFLILPIQRIPRYKLLLTDLLRHTPEDHPDYQDLVDAVQKISGIASWVNESQHKWEMMEKIVDLQSTMAGLDEANVVFLQEKLQSLVSASRTFVKEGDVIEIVTKKKIKKRFMILFNDLLVLCDHRKVETGLFKKTASSTMKYQYAISIPLDDAVVADVSDSKDTTTRIALAKAEQARAILSQQYCTLRVGGSPTQLANKYRTATRDDSDKSCGTFSYGKIGKSTIWAMTPQEKWELVEGAQLELQRLQHLEQETEARKMQRAQDAAERSKALIQQHMSQITSGSTNAEGRRRSKSFGESGAAIGGISRFTFVRDGAGGRSASSASGTPPNPPQYRALASQASQAATIATQLLRGGQEEAVESEEAKSVKEHAHRRRHHHEEGRREKKQHEKREKRQQQTRQRRSNSLGSSGSLGGPPAYPPPPVPVSMRGPSRRNAAESSSGGAEKEKTRLVQHMEDVV